MNPTPTSHHIALFSDNKDPTEPPIFWGCFPSIQAAEAFAASKDFPPLFLDLWELNSDDLFGQDPDDPDDLDEDAPFETDDPSDDDDDEW